MHWTKPLLHIKSRRDTLESGLSVTQGAFENGDFLHLECTCLCFGDPGIKPAADTSQSAALAACRARPDVCVASIHAEESVISRSLLLLLGKLS